MAQAPRMRPGGLAFSRPLSSEGAGPGKGWLGTDICLPWLKLLSWGQPRIVAVMFNGARSSAGERSTLGLPQNSDEHRPEGAIFLASRSRNSG